VSGVLSQGDGWEGEGRERCYYVTMPASAPGLELVTGHNTTHHQHDTEPELQPKNFGVAVYKLLLNIGPEPASIVDYTRLDPVSSRPCKLACCLPEK